MITVLFQGKKIPLDNALYSKPKITEELNGQYSLELYIAITKPEIKTGTILASSKRKAGIYKAGEIRNDVEVITKSEMIQEEMIIYADGNTFRIKEKRDTNNSVYVYAKQIFFADFADNFLEDVRPTQLNGAGALNWIAARTQFPHNFTFLSDIATTGTAYYIRKNALDSIMNEKNSFLNVWGGEIEADNYNIKINKTRGIDRGVTIAYGKNLDGFEANRKTGGVYTRIMPTGRDEEGNIIELPEKYIDSPYINSYDNPKILHQDYPEIKVDSENNITLENVYTQLREEVQNLFDGGIDIPYRNYTVNFKALSSTEEYKNFAILETVYLGDTVTIKNSKLKMNLKARAVKSTKEYNAAKKKWEYKEIELGLIRTNYLSSTKKTVNELKQTIDTNKTALQKAIEYATDKLAGNKGGYVYFKRNANGEPEEIFVMDTPDPMTAQKCIRINKEGIGGSTTGINGPFSLGLLIDGTINATMITTGLINASLIKGGTLILGGDSNGNGSFKLVSDLDVILATMDNKGIKSYKNGKLATWLTGGGLDFYDSWREGTKYIGAVYGSGANDDTNNKGLTIRINDTNSRYIEFITESMYFMVMDKTKTDGDIIKFYQPTTFDSSAKFNSNVTFAYPITLNSDFTIKGWLYGDGTNPIMIYDSLNVADNLQVYGTKNCVQKTQNYGDRAFGAYEMAENYLGDIGEGTTDTTGICKINIDPIIVESLNTTSYYHVFLQKHGPGDIWVEETHESYFIIKGEPNMRFSWELKAKRRGFEEIRLTEVQQASQ